jgi:hypothetical protein
VGSLGTFQDGGLQHNNPASIAQWEMKFLWPNKPEPDFALSLGTGTSATSSSTRSLHTSRFYIRLFKSFMRNIDGEDAWKRFFNSVSLNMRNRFHRLNVQFAGPEPSLDDASIIPELKNNVLQTIRQDKCAVPNVMDSIIASIFYFELDTLPEFERGGYSCCGYIFCRMDIPLEGLRYLYNRLYETSSWFLIQGSPIRCVQSIPTAVPPFKCRVTFRAETLEEIIGFSIRGITASPKPLSGFPTTLGKLLAAQQLESPFGTVDHAVREKPLPALPIKRTRGDLNVGAPSTKRPRI